MRAHCRRSRAGARLRAMFGIQELLRRAKFATVKASCRFVNSGDLPTFAHLVGLRECLDRAAIDLVIDVGANVVSVLARGGNSAVSARRAECPRTWSPACA
jgi:hypothetical protein